MEFAFNPAARWSTPASWFLRAPTRRPMAPPAQPDAGTEPLHALPRGATLAVDAPLGQEVYCIAGTLWITHDRDPEDHVVEAGRTYVPACGTRMLVHALADARFVVEPSDD
jgi:quercetin dioxygenase-like cupin family protein